MEAFCTRVYNEYGCGEVGSIAHECEQGSMHIMAQNLIIEVVNGKRTDKSGKILVTDLFNYAMPLIRYDVGDYATLSELSCPCGRGLPVIEMIHGRAYDMIIDPGGKSHHPEILMYVFEELKTRNPGIDQFQVIQKRHDLLTINLVTGEGYDKTTEKVTTECIRNVVHRDFTTVFNYTNSIPREASGKLRIIKSEIQQ